MERERELNFISFFHSFIHSFAAPKLDHFFCFVTFLSVLPLLSCLYIFHIIMMMNYNPGIRRRCSIPSSHSHLAGTESENESEMN